MFGICIVGGVSITLRDMTYQIKSDETAEAEYRLVHQAICAIASHCDGAISQDGQGFNGSDTKFGRRISQIPFESWTSEIKEEAARILGNTYRVQAQNWTGIDARELTVVREAAEVYTNHTARDQARQAEKRLNAKSQRHVSLEGGRLVFDFPFDGQIKDQLKAAGCRWDPSTKTWWILRAACTREIVDITLAYGFQIKDADTDAALEAQAQVEAVNLGTGTVKVQGTNLLVDLVGRLDRDAFSGYRALKGYQWIRGSSESIVAGSLTNLNWLEEKGFTGVPAAREALKGAIDAAQANIEASRAATSNVDLSALSPEGLAPYPFQAAGVEYALKARRTFIADEMGLGKTVQTILAVKASFSYPAVVVCPATLKGNWAKEIARWDPECSVTVLSGRKANPEALQGFNWIVVNYDVLAAWEEAIETALPLALVVDESHYVKEAKAQRTKALLKLSQAVPESGLVLALTGTPLLNRPVELITQLRLLGRLEDVAPAPRGAPTPQAYEFAFKFEYCGPRNNGFGWEFKGASNTKALSDKLRQSCFIRREREDVLDLKATTHYQIPLALNGALNDYRRAERDIIGYIKAEAGNAAALRAKRAEVLVQLNTLRRLSELAKIPATIEWVENWLDSNPGRKLVVFSEAIDAQKAFVDHFQCPHILGGQKDVEAQKIAFQEGEARVIICSLKAAREGHTLTAASDVVFTSLGWTPGGLQQAEDRCNRIGQEADQVVAWQLQAQDTIDQVLARLIEHKRLIFNGVVKGEDNDLDEDVFEGLIDYLSSL